MGARSLGQKTRRGRINLPRLGNSFGLFLRLHWKTGGFRLPPLGRQILENSSVSLEKHLDSNVSLEKVCPGLTWLGPPGNQKITRDEGRNEKIEGV